MKDIFLHTKTNLNLNGNTYFSFDTNAEGSAWANRFRIVWNQKINSLIKELMPVAPDENIKASMIVYPNPVVNKIVNLQFSSIAPGTYTLLMTNLQGQKVFTDFVQITSQMQTKSIQLPATLGKGKYQLVISGEKGLVRVLQV